MLAGQSLALQVRHTDPPARLTAAAGRKLAEPLDAETDPERLVLRVAVPSGAGRNPGKAGAGRDGREARDVRRVPGMPWCRYDPQQPRQWQAAAGGRPPRRTAAHDTPTGPGLPDGQTRTSGLHDAGHTGRPTDLIPLPWYGGARWRGSLPAGRCQPDAG